MAAVTQVVLVGGTPNIEQFQTRLEAWGVNVCAHIPFLPLSVPKDATAIVVFKSHCCHNLFHAAKSAANKRNLPLCVVDLNWTLAIPLLQQAGILPQPAAQDFAQDPTSEDFRDATIRRQSGKIAYLEAEVRRLRDELDKAGRKSVPTEGYSNRQKREATGLSPVSLTSVTDS